MGENIVNHHSDYNEHFEHVKLVVPPPIAIDGVQPLHHLWCSPKKPRGPLAPFEPRSRRTKPCSNCRKIFRVNFLIKV